MGVPNLLEGGGALAEKFRVGARPNGLKFGYWPDRTDLPGSRFLGEFLLRNAVNVVKFCKKCGESVKKYISPHFLQMYGYGEMFLQIKVLVAPNCISATQVHQA